MVDAASTEGRDPLNDINVINNELARYNDELIKRPQVIAANKCDVFYGTEEDTVISLLKEEFEPKGIKVFPISAVSGKGVKELLYYVKSLLDEMPDEPTVFEKEFSFDEMEFEDEPYTVTYDEKNKVYNVEGPRIEKMLLRKVSSSSKNSLKQAEYLMTLKPWELRRAIQLQCMTFSLIIINKKVECEKTDIGDCNMSGCCSTFDGLTRTV